MKPKRKWKRWAPLLLLLFVLYYLGVFSLPLRMTRENTGLTSLPPGVDVPIRADKKGVDYVKAYEILFPQVSEITEENAWRDVVQALGQGVFYRSGSVTIKNIFEQDVAYPRPSEGYWQEYCRRLALNPEEVKTPAQPYVFPHELMEEYADKKFTEVEEVSPEATTLESEPPPEVKTEGMEGDEEYDDEEAEIEAEEPEMVYRPSEESLALLEDFARQHGLRLPVWLPWYEGNSVSTNDIRSITDNLHDELFYEAGWSREAYPELAAWVDAHSPTFDLVAAAVRKSRYFMPFFKETDDQPLVLLEQDDVGLNNQLANGFAVRATMHIHARDAEKALADIESLYRLSRHMLQMPGLIAQLTGVNANRKAVGATRGLLAKNICTAEQWARLATMLDSLPKPLNCKQAVVYEDWLAYEFLGKMVTFDDSIFPPKLLFLLDANAMTKRYAALCRMRYDPAKEKYLHSVYMWAGYLKATMFLTRSRSVAGYIFMTFDGTSARGEVRLREQNQRFHMTRLAIALKQYKMEKGEYPENLAVLVPEYIATAAQPPAEVPYFFDFNRDKLGEIKYVRDGEGFMLYAADEDADPVRLLWENEAWRSDYLIRLVN